MDDEGVNGKRPANGDASNEGKRLCVEDETGIRPADASKEGQRSSCIKDAINKLQKYVKQTGEITEPKSGFTTIRLNDCFSKPQNAPEGLIYGAFVYIYEQLDELKLMCPVDLNETAWRNLVVVKHFNPPCQGVLAITFDLDKLKISSVIPGFEQGYKLLIRIEDFYIVSIFFKDGNEITSWSEDADKTYMNGAEHGTPNSYPRVSGAYMTDRSHKSGVGLNKFIKSLGLIPVPGQEATKVIPSGFKPPFTVYPDAFDETRWAMTMCNLSWDMYRYVQQDTEDKRVYYELNVANSENIMESNCKLTITCIKTPAMHSRFFSITVTNGSKALNHARTVKIYDDKPHIIERVMKILINDQFHAHFKRASGGLWGDWSPSIFSRIQTDHNEVTQHLTDAPLVFAPDPTPFGSRLADIEKICARMSILMK